MKNVIKTLALVFGIAIMSMSCEKSSISEQEQVYNEINDKTFFETIKPTGVVTPKNLRRPGNAHD